MFERGESYLHSKEKRFLDIGVSICALTLVGPVINILAGIKYLEDGESPFFIQERLNGSGERLLVIKIRSMKSDMSLPDSERITKFGSFLRKTHLDELPQFLNVFVGEMSLIGPRPITRDAINIVEKTLPSGRFNELQSNYNDSKKGLTGMGQIMISQKDWRRYHPEMYYRRNASLGLDLFILFKTAEKVTKALINRN